MDNEIAERIAKALERIAEALPPFFEQGEQHLAEMSDLRLALSAIAYAPDDEQVDTEEGQPPVQNG
jgi:hypothetical protein